MKLTMSVPKQGLSRTQYGDLADFKQCRIEMQVKAASDSSRSEQNHRTLRPRIVDPEGMESD